MLKNGIKRFSTSQQRINVSQIKSFLETSEKPKYNPVLEEEQFKKEFTKTHKNAKYTSWLSRWAYEGFRIGWFNKDRDTETGTARSNSAAAFPNRLSEVLFRSPVLQNRFIMNLAFRFLDKRNVIEYQVNEPQPRITTNSVFLYKDNSRYFINRRGLERLFILFVLFKGLNFYGVLLYSSIALYFQLYVRFCLNLLKKCSKGCILLLNV